MDEARGQFENPQEVERLPLEAVTRRLMMTQQAEKAKCVLYEL
jgi:hypothetical protein